jgi:hypothetical protein
MPPFVASWNRRVDTSWKISSISNDRNNDEDCCVGQEIHYHLKPSSERLVIDYTKQQTSMLLRFLIDSLWYWCTSPLTMYAAICESKNVNNQAITSFLRPLLNSFCKHKNVALNVARYYSNHAATSVLAKEVMVMNALVQVI